MIPKTVAMVIVLAGVVVVLFTVFRPSCPDEPRSDSFRRSDERVTQRDVGQLETLRVVRNVPHRAPEGGRNVFAYQRVPLPVQVSRVIEPVLPLLAASAPVVVPAAPEFPYRYIGKFGPDADPFAVFIRNRDVVNARVGELLDGELRLNSIGIESVDVLLANGSIRRVSIQP